MRNVIIALIIIASFWVIYTLTSDKPNTKLTELKERVEKKEAKVVDHSKFDILQKKFNTPQEVTAACISCHNERHKEVMSSAHWTWDREEYIEGRGIVKIGKKNLINNFCIGIAGSEGSCNKCHAGFGWSDKNFDFSNELNVDCMVCHDNSGTYKKGSELAGYPAKDVDFNLVAQSVGKPKNDNCGSCHFIGGGGNNVKHGDLEVALLTADKKVDVHMGIDGANINCVDCHKTENHKISGKMYSVSSMNEGRLECESCHSEKPHAKEIINEHTLKVACQTCHIPQYAKVNPTKMHWDWSKACKTMDPEYKETDSTGAEVYLAKKGKFVWQKNVEPEYIWFNGTADHYFLGDKISDTSKPVRINSLKGNYADKNSKIIPVKIHRAKQVYDPINKTLVQPKLWDKEPGNNALWVDCRTTPINIMWDKAAQAGMDYVGLPYSGTYGFIYTEMYWPVNHMVSTKDEALQCKDCHKREDGRLANLKDFYMPGRDYNKTVDATSITLIILALFGISVHLTGRLVSNRKRNRLTQSESKEV